METIFLIFGLTAIYTVHASAIQTSLHCSRLPRIFAELNRFRKRLDECHSLTDKWCYALKHIGELAERPDRLDQKVFEKFFRACEIARFDNGQKLQYVKDMITERDQINIINTARKEGMEKGRSEERVNIAKAMKLKGMEYGTISEMTGLSETEVAEL